MIEEKNIQLRTVKEKDLAEIYHFLNSIRFKGEYLPNRLLSEQKFRDEFFNTCFWEDNKGMVLISIKEKIVGAIWFDTHLIFESLILHYYIFRPEERGKGHMTKALRLFTEYLFQTKKVNRLEISIPNYSKAAIRIAQKCRFQFEGILRGALFQRGSFVDLCLYSLLRSDRLEIEKISSHP